jgi:polyhydroxyalkanoate synthesis regulator phasin
MSEPAGQDAASVCELVERLALAGVGAVALSADRADQLARDLADRGDLRRDEVRQAIEEAMVRWRGDATRITERAGESFQTLFDQLGLVTREAYDELELRVSQLEHRLRLAEGRIEEPKKPPAPPH